MDAPLQVRLDEAQGRLEVLQLQQEQAAEAEAARKAQAEVEAQAEAEAEARASEEAAAAAAASAAAAAAAAGGDDGELRYRLFSELMAGFERERDGWARQGRRQQQLLATATRYEPRLARLEMPRPLTPRHLLFPVFRQVSRLWPAWICPSSLISRRANPVPHALPHRDLLYLAQVR